MLSYSLLDAVAQPRDNCWICLKAGSKREEVRNWKTVKWIWKGVQSDPEMKAQDVMCSSVLSQPIFFSFIISRMLFCQSLKKRLKFFGQPKVGTI